MSSAKTVHAEPAAKPNQMDRILSITAWVFSALMVLVLVYIIFEVFIIPAQASVSGNPSALAALTNSGTAALPSYENQIGTSAVHRSNSLRTLLSERQREAPVEYTIEQGDSLFGIAKFYNVKPESVLWSNSKTLNDDPHMISVGDKLIIPPVDGILYEWKEGDSLNKIASLYKAKVEDIIAFPGNHLDMTDPQVTAGEYVMVPGGSRELRQWVVPTIARGAAGVNKSIIGPGSCDTGEGGAFGTGTFIWPAGNHYLSGNEYWSGHLGIDIAAYTGDPLYATDSGVIVYAGSISGGYGNMVMIDHGNGYQSLYAHLSSISVRCGQSVYQGAVIGAAGSTGNSTGPHLHFEIRYMGGFINPLLVLY